MTWPTVAIRQFRRPDDFCRSRVAEAGFKRWKPAGLSAASPLDLKQVGARNFFDTPFH